mmetsp:Transcript_36527/g.96212  ORF Transcript_36527/g.96212 Transcript_36527/m.96212 type:complete len:154 (+) Transcript_36527:680-1141(+)
MVKTFLEDDLGRPRIVIEQHLLGTLFVDLVLDARVPMVEMVLIRPLIPQLAYLFMLDPSGVHRGIDSRRPSFATVLSSTQMPPEGLDALVIDLEDDAFKVPRRPSPLHAHFSPPSSVFLSSQKKTKNSPADKECHRHLGSVFESMGGGPTLVH